MKRLFLIRHAKAEPPSFQKNDFDRELTDKGKADAEKMAVFIKNIQPCPDLISTSTAKRSWSTAKRFANAYKIDKAKIHLAPEIYQASSDSLLEWIRSMNNEHETLMLLGHNPSLSQLASFLSQNMDIEMAPCGVCMLQFELEKWEYLAYQNGKLKLYYCP